MLHVPRRASPLGAQVHYELGFSLDATDPDRLILYNAVEVWTVRLRHGEARRLVSTRRTFSCVITVPVLTLVDIAAHEAVAVSVDPEALAKVEPERRWIQARIRTLREMR